MDVIILNIFMVAFMIIHTLQTQLHCLSYLVKGGMVTIVRTNELWEIHTNSNETVPPAVLGLMRTDACAAFLEFVCIAHG